MNVVDPSNLPKPQRKLTGGEDFEAEPGLKVPSQEWKDSQVTLLKLTIRDTGNSWRYALPVLNSWTDYYQNNGNERYVYEEETGKYYQKQYLQFKVSWKYYKGNKRRSYMFWPKHVNVNYTSKGLVQQWPDKLLTVKTESGEGQYAYLGVHDLAGQRYDVCALWKSTGTMKPRRNQDAIR